MIVINADPGASSTKGAIPDSTGEPQLLHNRWGEPKTDAAVYFPEEGGHLLGDQARNALLADHSRGAPGWKWHMGTEKKLCEDAQGNSYVAKDLLAFHLKEMKEVAEQKTGEAVEEVVICIPADYTEPQRRDTLDAAGQAGLDVITLVPEPTAAALGNDVHKRGVCTALVYDWGGWTFDVSIIAPKGKLFKVQATDGKPDLGGRDVDAILIEEMLNRFERQYGFRPSREEHPVFYQDLVSRIEQAKIALSVREKASLNVSCDGKVISEQFSRDEFESLVEPKVQETMDLTKEVIEDAGMGWDDIDVVIPVGGSSSIPLVREELDRISGGKVSKQCEPLYAAAYGAVVAGRIEKERKDEEYVVGDKRLPSTGMSLEDVVGNPIGVLVLDGNDELVVDQILSRNTTVPSKQTELYAPAVANQENVLIQVVQAPDGTPKDQCTLLGKFRLQGIPPNPDRTERFQITFEFDANGMLRASARDRESGKTAELEIDYRNGDGDTA